MGVHKVEVSVDSGESSRVLWRIGLGFVNSDMIRAMAETTRTNTTAGSKC
jgi:hypothetical protein